MDPVRVVLANEPRSYREVIAAAIALLRPCLEVTAVEPADLDVAVARLRPQLVLCSRLTDLVQSEPIAWVVLYPDGVGQAETSVAGCRVAIADIEFPTVLAVLDEAARLAQTS